MTRINECCNDAQNMKREQLSADMLVDICQVCGSKHYEFTVDAAIVGLQTDEPHADL